jgi:DNA topoisomerase I
MLSCQVIARLMSRVRFAAILGSAMLDSIAGASSSALCGLVSSGTATAKLLSYGDDCEPGIRRRKSGSAFAYYDCEKRLIREPEVLARVRSLAIPPAYTDVWICPNPNGHIQATGRDARGRKQYRYHAQWSLNADRTKFMRMLEFGRALPELRARVEADLQRRGLERAKILATVVRLLETTLIRVGNADYARDNHSYGLTTLRNRHVAIEGAKLRFEFRGKSGKLWRLSLTDRRIARVIRRCQELPGQHLFQYVDDSGSTVAVSSTDVNAYLREISGREITAKDFRTWAGTALAASALSQRPFDNASEAKRHLRDAIAQVAARLGNTATVCRKAYIHPEVIAAYLAKELKWARNNCEDSSDVDALLPENERRLLAFLSRRFEKTATHQA